MNMNMNMRDCFFIFVFALRGFRVVDEIRDASDPRRDGGEDGSARPRDPPRDRGQKPRRFRRRGSHVLWKDESGDEFEGDAPLLFRKRDAVQDPWERNRVSYERAHERDRPGEKALHARSERVIRDLEATRCQR